MSSRYLVSCHVSSALRRDFYDLAKSRDLTAASLLRQLIVREVKAPPDFSLEIRNHILFMAIGIDGLLEAHPDPGLRPRLIEIWQERVAQEDERHGA